MNIQVDKISGGIMDYSKFYRNDLEKYLFDDVINKFEENGYINAFDFFCIIIWKANRAKTKVANKICKIEKSNYLDQICINLTREIYKEADDKEKLRILLKKWKFGLPMASAILTVLYPTRFTVYDIRVCNVLKDFHNLTNKGIDNKIKGYFDFIIRVKDVAKTKKKSLRNIDKFMWGESFYNELKKDVNDNFKRLRKEKGKKSEKK